LYTQIEQVEEALGEDRVAAKAPALQVVVGQFADVLARADAYAVHVAVFLCAALLRLTAERIDESRAVRARPVDDDAVDAREKLDVDVDVIEQEGVQHLAEEKRGARSSRVLVVARLAHHPSLDLARAADREDVRRAQAQRGGDGCVLAQAAIEVELPIDAHRREEQRNGGAGERVLRADTVGAKERAWRRSGRDGEIRRGLHEDDRAPGRHLRARDGECAEHVLSQAA
jgi:hypothetical protein